VGKLSNIVFRGYQHVIHSLAFYPTLIALGFFLLCLLNISIEYQPWLLAIKERVDVGLVRNAENARLILGTLVGGILTLMVFSFSMVMVVLNNASAALSPRVIPGLISSKSHQKTLGFYLGTILYALLLITTIEQAGIDKVPSLGVLITLGLGIACLGLFVHFIRSISQSIQVEYILSSLYRTTLEKLTGRERKLSECEEPPCWPDTQDWSLVHSTRNGYFKAVNVSAVNALLRQHKLRMTVLAHRGFFVTKGYPLFKLDREVEEEVCEQLLDCFGFFIEEYASSHYYFGCKQISEIAVKALSPGINDPGTAIKAIDMLSVLFSQRLTLPDLDIAPLTKESPRLFYRELTLDQMLLQILGPIRSYGSNDVSVLVCLLQAFKNLLYQTTRENQRSDLIRHAQSVLDSADQQLAIRRDREEINALVTRINRVSGKQAPALKPINIPQD
jgi:uncharacterized membrane protein